MPNDQCAPLHAPAPPGWREARPGVRGVQITAQDRLDPGQPGVQGPPLHAQRPHGLRLVAGVVQVAAQRGHELGPASRVVLEQRAPRGGRPPDPAGLITTACQAGNPASLPVVPTITGGGAGGHPAGMAPDSDAATGDGQTPPGSQPKESLSVAEVVLAILHARKTMPWATAASISRETHRDLVHVSVRLLESSSPSPAGRQEGNGEVVAAFTVRRLGEDLATAFGQKDVIILK